MAFLIYIGALNLLIIPFVIYVQIQGSCKLITPFAGQGATSVCPYITNPFLNILYLNAILIALGVVIWANGQIVPSHPKKHRFPHHQ